MLVLLNPLEMAGLVPFYPTTTQLLTDGQTAGTYKLFSEALHLLLPVRRDQLTNT
jgi:hypothetical protein